MTEEEFLAKVQQMRERGSSPKQIAKDCIGPLSMGISSVDSFRREFFHAFEAPDLPTPIRFGRDGQPYYVSGPYDNPRAVISALDATVGSGNYHFIIHA